MGVCTSLTLLVRMEQKSVGRSTHSLTHTHTHTHKFIYIRDMHAGAAGVEERESSRWALRRRRRRRYTLVIAHLDTYFKALYNNSNECLLLLSHVLRLPCQHRTRRIHIRAELRSACSSRANVTQEISAKRGNKLREQSTQGTYACKVYTNACIACQSFIYIIHTCVCMCGARVRHAGDSEHECMHRENASDSCRQYLRCTRLHP